MYGTFGLLLSAATAVACILYILLTLTLFGLSRDPTFIHVPDGQRPRFPSIDPRESFKMVRFLFVSRPLSQTAVVLINATRAIFFLAIVLSVTSAILQYTSM
jgi:hypothetical protein